MTDRFVPDLETVLLVLVVVMATVVKVLTRVQISNAVATPSVQQTMTVFEILPVGDVAFVAANTAAAAAAAVGLI